VTHFKLHLTLNFSLLIPFLITISSTTSFIYYLYLSKFEFQIHLSIIYSSKIFAHILSLTYFYSHSLLKTPFHKHTLKTSTTPSDLFTEAKNHLLILSFSVIKSLGRTDFPFLPQVQFIFLLFFPFLSFFPFFFFFLLSCLWLFDVVDCFMA
jgi:hypothetical protein